MVETIVVKKTKREFMVGNFRLVQPSVGKKEIWIFNKITGESLAIKADRFETAVRTLCNTIKKE